MGRGDVEFKFGEAASDSVTRIDYKRYFPSLSKLTIWPVYSTTVNSRNGEPLISEQAASWSQFVRILEAFTRSVYDEEEDNFTPVRSVESLNIPFLLKGKYHCILDDLEEIFPNVVFTPKLEEARVQTASRAKLRDSDSDEDTAEESDSEDEEFGYGGGFGGWRRTSEVEAEKRQKEKKRLAKEEQRLNAPLNLFG